MLLEVSLILHASPLATIAARRFASVTTVGSGVASKSVAQAGTKLETYEKMFNEVRVPAGVVTTTSAGPSVPAGVTAVIVVDETTTKFVASAPPINTLVALVKYAPEIVIGVPPTIDPWTGATDAMNGAHGPHPPSSCPRSFPVTAPSRSIRPLLVRLQIHSIRFIQTRAWLAAVRSSLFLAIILVVQPV